MSIVKTKVGRRSFLKTSAAAGGGLLISFSWLAACAPGQTKEEVMAMPKEWFELNGFIKIGENGVVTIMSPNPEIGQNVKTSMPMIVAEELDVDWDMVVVEQAPLNTEIFTRQLAGGSQSIRQGWNSLRSAGAAGRAVLRQAAANEWGVPVEEVITKAGKLMHLSGKEAGFGTFASAAALLEAPEELALKERSEFSIIGTSRRNVDGKKIATGHPLFGLDYTKEGMLTAMIIHPPAFGMKLKSFDADLAKSMSGIVDVISIDTYPEDMEKQWSDINAFPQLVAVVGQSTWQVMQAKKSVNVTWEETESYRKIEDSTSKHKEMLVQRSQQKAEVERVDGDPEAAFKRAAKVVERTYSAPFLAHNTMEPMNFFADVTDDKAELVGPIQTPEYLELTLKKRLGMPLDKINIQMTRMGGGFGRRLYGHFAVEAAVISQRVKAPVKLVYTREDDMTQGTYRPAYHATYRAALDENNNLIGFHVNAGGIPSSPLFANRFPAGAVENYKAESWTIESNISSGAWRAPRSNFIAGAEQSFLDEVAEEAGKDPIEFRLELFDRAINNPVGEKNDYDAERYAGVLKLVREKSNWGKEGQSSNRGVSAYYCHNSYVAQVLDLEMENGKPRIKNVSAAVDCGIVVNPIAANNMMEGGIVDGIGHALYSAISFKDGAPENANFDKYRLIRHNEAPENIDVHFVDNGIDPTGLGEPPFPPIVGALANALYKATGKRHYHQPFMEQSFSLG
ncbi:MAG: molybdopterin cofactor-binding domain-containing protein [Cyclobacteriaceae bacterium]